MTDSYPIRIEFVEGPYDGRVIDVRDPGEHAPAHIDILIDVPDDPDDWPEVLEPGTDVHRYRAPGPGAETEEAVASFTGDRPIKYRYVGVCTT